VRRKIKLKTVDRAALWNAHDGTQQIRTIAMRVGKLECILILRWM